jgi:hypothetical protein
MPTVKELQAAGCESLRAIAAGLEERGIPARAVASGLRSRWPDCWRLPALSTPQASPSPREMNVKLAVPTWRLRSTLSGPILAGG